MERIIYNRALEAPLQMAITDGAVCLTYAGLLTESIDLAHRLRAKRVSAPEPVGILLGPGVQQIVAQLAILLVGGTCVPIEPTIPELRLQSLLEDIEAKYIITGRESWVDLPGFESFCIEYPQEPQSNGVPNWEFGTTAPRSHILFTSGSTGKPKPVQVRADSIVHLATRTPLTPLSREDRVAHFNNAGFDLSLFEIWATLLSGATVVTLPRKIAVDPGELPSFLQEHEVTVIIMTAALFEITVFVSPAAFHTLRHVITAGDVANARAMRRMLNSGPPDHLWNAYGPTECTTFVTAMEVLPEEAQRDRISIGRPVGETRIYLLDENQMPIQQSGRRGEIYVGGPGLAMGYLNRPSENKSCFIEIPRQDLRTGQDEVVRLYRTGDLAEWRPKSDCLDFIGRTDEQVKHQGFRVELGEIERVLRNHVAVQAVVVAQQMASTNCMDSLVAFVIANEADEVTPEALVDFSRRRLPSYMVPDNVELVSTFPLTAHGKVDRQGLLQQWVDSAEDERELDADGDGEKKDVIRGLWSDLLKVPRINEDDDFFALGATSLQAASLLGMVQERMGRTVTMEQLFRHSRLSDFQALLEPEEPVSEGDAPDDTQAWMSDVNLVNEIETVPDWESPSEGRVFVTGVTGFVGPHLLHSLMRRPGVKQIACLVRSKGSEDVVGRVRCAMQRYDLWEECQEHRSKLLVFEGNLSDDHLGLDPELFAWLAGWASVVFHLGAKINFCESYREHRDANVLGTRNALHLAAAGRRKSFHYLSSIDTWGSTGFILGTKELYKDEPLQPHIQGLRYDLGYAQSQWTAEAMVQRMRDRGLPTAIYRPGFIIGHSKTGASNPDDFVSRIIAGSIQLGLFPRLDQRLEYVPVDYVVSAMLHIASSNANLGHSYSLVAPDRRESVTVVDTARVLNEAGHPVKLVDYPEWAAQAATHQRLDGPLAPLLPMLQERVLGQLTRWEASQYSPVYRCDNAVRALRESGIVYRGLDEVMVRRAVAFWKRKGFYDLIGVM
ncbi:NRPS-like enzyme [Aspergillus steynii IBT 23096]|uniref:NRPS-like enzyme n=1 Tax=Aspergillus steynii IBT 23096 TaxID=1392250 RepID=A0A2I2G9U2_9EURO|nr:NRPS-like enzyme [Aspergillus steynii IBT 23096]PLB49644.1 NRPS-like enzyme [Aspergillus steynii IBT 23096]